MSYLAPTLYKLDPFYRDERGRFIPKPARRPTPLALVPLDRVIGKGVGKTSETATQAAFIWSVRCVFHTKDLEWQVRFVKVANRG